MGPSFLLFSIGIPRWRFPLADSRWFSLARCAALEIQRSFMDFKREIARNAENSRSGKPIPRRIIMQVGRVVQVQVGCEKTLRHCMGGFLNIRPV